MNSRSPRGFRSLLHPWGLLSAAGVVACSTTLVGFLGRFSWFLDLFSHFRVQYLVGLGILGAVFLLARRWKTAAVFLLFASVNLATVLPLYVGAPSDAVGATETLRAMLINVNTHGGDPDRVGQVVREADPDILVLEEISDRWVRRLQWLTQSHPHSRVQPRGDNFGIGLYSKLPLTQGRIVTIGDAGVPSIVATVETGQGKLGIVATHPVPPAGAAYSRWRNDQFDKLPKHVPSSLPVMLLGDLNTTPWNFHFKRLLKRTGLKDSAKGRGIQPTWRRYNPLFALPVDHCLHSADVSVVSRSIGAGVGSDHHPLIVDFVITRMGGNPVLTPDT
jgi:endonuclease/exonuclease/phosphatase (EEP) superfamily protein YafD